MREHKVSSLPKWAQRRIERQDQRIEEGRKRHVEACDLMRAFIEKRFKKQDARQAMKDWLRKISQCQRDAFIEAMEPALSWAQVFSRMP